MHHPHNHLHLLMQHVLPVLPMFDSCVENCLAQTTGGFEPMYLWFSPPDLWRSLVQNLGQLPRPWGCCYKKDFKMFVFSWERRSLPCHGSVTQHFSFLWTFGRLAVFICDPWFWFCSFSHLNIFNHIFRVVVSSSLFVLISIPLPASLLWLCSAVLITCFHFPNHLLVYLLSQSSPCSCCSCALCITWLVFPPSLGLLSAVFVLSCNKGSLFVYSLLSTPSPALRSSPSTHGTRSASCAVTPANTTCISRCVYTCIPMGYIGHLTFCYDNLKGEQLAFSYCYNNVCSI